MRKIYRWESAYGLPESKCTFYKENYAHPDAFEEVDTSNLEELARALDCLDEESKKACGLKIESSGLIDIYDGADWHDDLLKYTMDGEVVVAVWVTYAEVEYIPPRKYEASLAEFEKMLKESSEVEEDEDEGDE